MLVGQLIPVMVTFSEIGAELRTTPVCVGKLKSSGTVSRAAVVDLNVAGAAPPMVSVVSTLVV